MKKIGVFLFLVLSINLVAIETNFTTKKVVLDKLGREVKVEIERISPDDIIEYNFEIINDNKLKEYELKPSIPIPKEMVLIEDKISPANFQVSVDGKTYSNYPVLDREGKPVDASAYKRIRWFIDEINPSETLNVSLRVKLKE